MILATGAISLLFKVTPASEEKSLEEDTFTVVPTE